MPGRVGCEPGAAEEPERCARKRALTSSFQAAGLGERGGAGDGAAAAVGAGGRLETEALKVILFQQFSVDRGQRVRRPAFRSLTDGAPGAESELAAAPADMARTLYPRRNSAGGTASE
jgi:hypothetical protein